MRGSRQRVRGRIAFTPSARARKYFDNLIDRMTEERGIEVYVTQREAFEHMVNLAESAEAALVQRPFRPPLVEVKRQ